MIRRLSNRMSAAAFAALAAGIAATAAFALSNGADNQAGAASSSDAAAPAPFAALQGSPNGDPADNPFNQTPGVDPSQAHQLSVPGHDVWAVASADFICIMAKSSVDPSVATGGCAPPDIVAQDGLFTSSQPAPDDVKAQGLPGSSTEVAALVPDGIESVTFSLPDGNTKDIAAVDNVVQSLLVAKPTGARFTDAAGAMHIVDFHRGQ
jgi:hypothetical protein